jgi:hypothetical protein
MGATKNMIRENNYNTEETAIEIAIAFATTKGATVTDFATRYPGSEGILAQVATEKWLGGTVPTNADTNINVRNIGLAMLEARKSALTFTLNQLATEKGLDADSVAERLNLPVALFWKLQRRLIAFETLPATLAPKLGEVLGKTANEIRAYLRLSPQIANGASFKSDTMPEIVQESFAEALASEGTPEEIAAWE